MNNQNNNGNLSENQGNPESGAIDNREEENTVTAAKRDITQEIKNALGREEVRELIYGNDEIVNEVIERYLRSLSRGVPVVRGLSALAPVRRPKTLSEAKAIVDGK